MRPGGEFQTIGPYELNWDTQQYKCWLSQWITSALLSILQAVNIFWYFLIIRIAIRYVSKGDAKDTRSDDEDYEDGDLEAEDSEAPVINHSTAMKPTLLVNGDPISPVEGSATGVLSRDSAGATKRK